MTHFDNEEREARVPAVMDAYAGLVDDVLGELVEITNRLVDEDRIDATDSLYLLAGIRKLQIDYEVAFEVGAGE